MFLLLCNQTITYQGKHIIILLLLSLPSSEAQGLFDILGKNWFNSSEFSRIDWALPKCLCQLLAYHLEQYILCCCFFPCLKLKVLSLCIMHTKTHVTFVQRVAGSITDFCLQPHLTWLTDLAVLYLDCSWSTINLNFASTPTLCRKHSPMPLDQISWNDTKESLSHISTDLESHRGWLPYLHLGYSGFQAVPSEGQSWI